MRQTGKTRPEGCPEPQEHQKTSVLPVQVAKTMHELELLGDDELMAVSMAAAEQLGMGEADSGDPCTQHDNPEP